MFNHKRIADPVHGTIGLSDLEVKIVNTPVFQRLRNVRHLGLAHYVFPGGDFSRFAHSLGVCHIAGVILDAVLRKNKAATESGLHKLSKKDIQEIKEFRLAALLHDVGHYPFSHAMEPAIFDHYPKQTYRPKSAGSKRTTTGKINAGRDRVVEGFNHERVGQEVIENDPDVSRIITKAGIDPHKIASVIMGEDRSRFANLVTSDLDADRIDYLMRTAHHTGLPYGAVDLEYLISQMRAYDDEHGNRRLCVNSKALRTVDHFLLSRYFDNLQVAFHKSVAAFEWILQDVLLDLIARGAIDCSSDHIIEMVRTGEWHHFDDGHMLQKVRNILQDQDRCAEYGEIWVEKAKSLLKRMPPKLIAEEEMLATRDAEKQFLIRKQSLQERIPSWAARFGIDEKYWKVWHLNKTLTRIASKVPFQLLRNQSGGSEREEDEHAVVIWNARRDEYKSIMEIPWSLMRVLADRALYCLRVYVLFPSGLEKKKELREQISDHIRNDLKHFSWK